MEAQNKRFWNAITNLNLLLSIMITIYHNDGYYFYDDGSLSQLTKRIIDIGKLGYLAIVPVSIFIFLSGFLFYRNMEWNKMKDKMLSRISSLVIPYICWNAIAGGVKTFHLLYKDISGTGDMLSFDIVSIIRGITITPYNGPLWTILQLIIFVMLAPVFYAGLKNKYIGIVVLAVAFVIERKFYVPILVGGRQVLFIYLFGAYIGLHTYEKIKSYEFSNLHYAMAGLMVVILCILNEMGIYNKICVLLGITPLYVICHFLAGYTERGSEIFYGLSFWIYVMHVWLQPYVMKLWSMMGVRGNLGALVSTFGAAAVTIMLCIITAKTCKKLLPRAYMVLSGGRG